jgi:hypothetical protein
MIVPLIQDHEHMYAGRSLSSLSGNMQTDTLTQPSLLRIAMLGGDAREAKGFWLFGLDLNCTGPTFLKIQGGKIICTKSVQS